MKSYVHGVSTEPLLGETIGQAFDRIATAHGERESTTAGVEPTLDDFGHSGPSCSAGRGVRQRVFALARDELPYDEEFLLAALLHDVGKAIARQDHVAAGLDALDGFITARKRA